MSFLCFICVCYIIILEKYFGKISFAVYRLLYIVVNSIHGSNFCHCCVLFKKSIWCWKVISLSLETVSVCLFKSLKMMEIHRTKSSIMSWCNYIRMFFSLTSEKFFQILRMSSVSADADFSIHPLNSLSLYRSVTVNVWITCNTEGTLPLSLYHQPGGPQLLSGRGRCRGEHLLGPIPMSWLCRSADGEPNPG